MEKTDFKIFAIGTYCPITQSQELFPRTCIFENLTIGKSEPRDLFPELKCAYLEVNLNPKTKKVTYQCLHPQSIMCTKDKNLYKGKRV